MSSHLQPQPQVNAAQRCRRRLALNVHVLLLAASLAGGLMGHALGAVITFNVNQAIPDYNTSGLVDQRTLSGVLGPITAMSLTLRIVGTGPDGAWNGDLYVTLAHDTGFAVLLNRTGVTGTEPLGYYDSGFDVTFDDHAPGDIHNYRLVLYGDPAHALTGSLTGTWQPDGRLVDPDLVLDTSPRTAFLNSFVGLDPNGEWTLFAADLNPDGTALLADWSLTLFSSASSSVPEPSTVACMLAAMIIVGAVCLRHGWRVRRVAVRDKTNASHQRC